MSSDAFYNDMAAVARELLQEFGQAWTITRTTGDDVDPVDGTVTPGTDTTYTPNGVLVDFFNYEKATNPEIEQGDRLLILDDTIEPTMEDRPTLDGEEWTIINIEIVKPANVGLVYRVQVRG